MCVSNYLFKLPKLLDKPDAKERTNMSANLPPVICFLLDFRALSPKSGHQGGLVEGKKTRIKEYIAVKI